MQSMSFGSRNSLRRQLGAALAVGALFATVSAGANAQTVTVTVSQAKTTNYCSPSQGGYYICVDMDPIQTQAIGSDKHVEITWNITSPGWIFDKNKGIDIQNKRNWVPKWVSDIQYTARNKEKDGVTYKYTINVTDRKTPLAWDPTIMN
jgi:hypothetical protein